MSDNTRYETGAMPDHHVPYQHGCQLIPLESNRKLDPYERLAWRQLVDTIIDCYMIARGHWQYFKSSGWSNPVTTIESATYCTLDWINSDRFAFYLMYFGYADGVGRARTMLCEVLSGGHRAEIESLMKVHNPAGTGGFTRKGT